MRELYRRGDVGKKKRLYDELIQLNRNKIKRTRHITTSRGLAEFRLIFGVFLEILNKRNNYGDMYSIVYHSITV